MGVRLERHFSKKDIQMVDKYKGSGSLVIREIHVRARDETLPTCQDGTVRRSDTAAEKGHEPCGWGHRPVPPPWKTVEGASTVKTGPPCDPAVPLLGVYLRKMASESQSCWLHVQCRLIHNNRGLATIKPASGSEWTKDAELIPQNVAQPRERGGPAPAERGGPPSAERWEVLHQRREGRSCIS